jgi:hypothetical protein
VLKTAFVEGRLTRDELQERVGSALTARTHADLATATVGIPAGVAAAAPGTLTPARARRRVGPRAKAGACMIVAAVIMIVDGALTGSAAGPEANGFYLLFIMTFVVTFVVWLCTISAHRGPSAGQRPQRQAPGGHDEVTPQAATAVPAERLPSASQARSDEAQATRACIARKPAARTATTVPRPCPSATT